MNISKKSSQNIFIMKSFAVLSIITAHCNSVSLEHSFLDRYTSRAIGSFGCVGVGFFLLIAGLLMHGTTRSFKDFFISKIKTIIVPWFFCGTLVYLYVYLRKGGLGIISLVKWLLGVDTYLYYLPVLFCLYLICYFVRHNKTVLYCYAAISILSNLATGLGFIKILNNYLNPLNFLLFFVIGVLIAEYDAFEKLCLLSRKIMVFTIPLYMVLVVVLAYFEIKVGYFILPYIPIEIIAVISVFGLSDKISDNPHKIFLEIGKMSYSLYLLHMPFAGVIAAVFGMVDFWGITLLRPIIVLIISYLSIKVLLFIISKLPCSKLFYTLLGTR